MNWKRVVKNLLVIAVVTAIVYVLAVMYVLHDQKKYDEGLILNYW